MDSGIRKSNQLFLEKRALTKAGTLLFIEKERELNETIHTLISRKEREIEENERFLFLPLIRELDKIGAKLTVYTHHEFSFVNVWVREFEIEIKNYKIGKNFNDVSFKDKQVEEKYKKALNLVSEFLDQLDTD